MKKQNTQVANPSGSQAIVRSRKPYDELTIVDDYMFCKVMQNKTLCRELLHRILGDTVGEIVEINYQETIDENYSAHGIRLDLWVTGADGTVYDIEMQAVDRKDLSKRIRYYQSTMDRAHLNKSQDYNELPQSFIIFLCPFDYLEGGLPVYTCRTVCIEDKSILLDDGVTKIILNSSASDKAESKELRSVLDYMNGKVTDDPYIKALENEIRDAKLNEKWRKDYMLLSAWEMDARREGREEGRAEGRTEGRIGELVSLVSDGILTVSQASARLGESEDAFRARLTK